METNVFTHGKGQWRLRRKKVPPIATTTVRHQASIVAMQQCQTRRHSPSKTQPLRMSKYRNTRLEGRNSITPARNYLRCRSKCKTKSNQITNTATSRIKPSLTQELDIIRPNLYQIALTLQIWSNSAVETQKQLATTRWSRKGTHLKEILNFCSLER